MMFGVTVIVLLVPLPRAPWLLLAGLGTVVVTTLLLSGLVPLVARATSTRLAVGVTVVVALAAVIAAVVLTVRGVSTAVLGIVVVTVGGVVHRVVVMIVERTVDAGPVALVAGAVGAVGYALTVSLAVVGGTTGSLALALVIGAVVGSGEGALAGRFLRGDLAAT